MRNTNAPSAAGHLRLKNHPAFCVVLAYDKYADGIRAKEFFDGLVFNHGELFHFICHLWKFDVLREPQLFETATRDALGADIRFRLPTDLRTSKPSLARFPRSDARPVTQSMKRISWMTPARRTFSPRFRAE